MSLTIGMLQFFLNRKSLFFHLLSHPAPDLHLPGQVHLHQHSDLISEVNLICVAAAGAVRCGREGEVTA